MTVRLTSALKYSQHLHSNTPPAAARRRIAGINSFSWRTADQRLLAGRSGLAVACLTAVREVQGSNQRCGQLCLS